jgi:hypothetical protein
MRKLLNFAICTIWTLLGIIPAGAQTITAVSGTVLDKNGVPYAGCTVLPQFVNVSGGATPTITATGAPLIPPTTPSLCTASGVFNVSAVANGSISPASTHWQFLICSAPGTAYPDIPAVGSQCFTTATITITGSTQDITGNINAVPAPALMFANLARNLGQASAQSPVGITDNTFHALIAANSDVQIPANFTNINPRKLEIHASGHYTNAAASVLNGEVMLCQVSGCATGTVVAPAGCTVTSTNQANNLTAGQWWIDCTLTTTATLGSSGTFTAKSGLCVNLGATTAVGCTDFLDTSAGAASAAVDQTVAEFVNIGWKFTTANAGNSATLDEMHVQVLQ